MNVLEVSNICKSFGELNAVDNVSFSINEGHIFGLLGPNGAGKTTTIRMVMNIIIPDSGNITVMGESDARKNNKIIGYLPEERGIYRKMKLGEVLHFLAELKRMKRKDAEKEMNYWLDRLGLMEWKKKKIEELSKGMQQKLQFIATILHKPKLLILDEPFLGLDPINANMIKEIILEQKKTGTTIIFSTHLMDSAEKLCDEILLINKGQIILSGNLSQIKQGFGKRNIQLKYDGKDDFLENSPNILKYDNFGNYVEVQLQESIKPQEFLKEIIDKVDIKKFEIVEPSLNDIFIETVKINN